MKKTELIGLEPIQDLIELTLLTAYVKHERIASLLVIAEPESGKTEVLKKYRKNDGVHTTKRFTAYGIQNDLVEGRIKLLFEKPKILGHILIFDFDALTSFKPNTVDSNIAFLDAISEDGLARESTYAINYDQLKPYVGLKAGIIAAINNEGFFTRSGAKVKRTIRQNMKKGGFFSRLLIISYRLSSKQLREIFDSIAEGRYRTDKDYVNLIAMDFPKKRTDIAISEKYSRKMIDLANDLADELEHDVGYRIKGIRLAKTLISLAKAHALRDKRMVVEEKDVGQIEFLSQWMNIRFEKLRARWTSYD